MFEPPTAADVPPAVSLAGLEKHYHPNRSNSLAGGQNWLQQMDQDQYAQFRQNFDVHYPFASEDEWKLAHWLTSSGLPQSQINSFLKLDYVSNMSASSAMTLLSSSRRSRISQVFAQHKNCRAVLKRFQMYPSGHIKLSPFPGIVQRIRLLFIGAMDLRSSRVCFPILSSRVAWRWILTNWSRKRRDSVYMASS